MSDRVAQACRRLNNTHCASRWRSVSIFTDRIFFLPAQRTASRKYLASVLELQSTHWRALAKLALSFLPGEIYGSLARLKSAISSLSDGHTSVNSARLDQWLLDAAREYSDGWPGQPR